MVKNEEQTNTKLRRTLEGVVVSDKMDKTITVLVKRFIKHLKYGKFIKRSKKYKAHDENNTHKVGDKVTIEECKPISKDKAFKVVGKSDDKLEL